MLRLSKLRDAEYVLEAVAGGLEDYYLGQGEAPGVWAGRLAEQLGLSGVVEADGLRALIDGRDPITPTGLGRRLDPKRVVRAFDATFSPPKSVSLLWAFATPEAASVVSIAHVEAVAAALAFYEERTAVARQQVDGLRRRVDTSGFAAATFVHRTSREGDPQLHTHCVIPNLVCRPDDSWVALDAGALYHWAKAAGCIYQEELRGRLSARLQVSWGPDRNGTRELLGFSEEQLGLFSKRTHQIEEHLAARGIKPTDPKSRMRADEAASLATRRPKDRSLTPELLRERWAAEAAEVGLPRGRALEAHVRQAAAGQWREMIPEDLERLMAQLVDPEVGLCAHDSRFSEAQVIEAVAAYCAGDLTAAQVQAVARTFLDSDSVIRLMDRDPSGRTPPRYSTVTHRQLEDRVLESLEELVGRAAVAVEPSAVQAALANHRRLR